MHSAQPHAPRTPRAFFATLSATILLCPLPAAAQQATDHGPAAAELDRQVARAQDLLREREHAAARDVLRQALAAANVDGTPLDRLAALDPGLWQLAELALYLGDLETAATSYRAVLRRRSEQLGEADVELQQARNGLANTLQELGQLAEARELKEKVLNAFETHLPDGHANVQMARASLAATASAMGDLPRAFELQKIVLAAFTETYTDDHALVQKARMSLAGTMAQLGDPRGALALEQQALAVRARTLPDDHPDLQRSRLAVATTLSELGHVREAIDLQRQVEAVFAEMLPENHPALLATRNNLATSLRLLGRVDEARTVLENVLRLRIANLPPDHPELHRTRSNLALVLRDAGDLPGALRLEREALAGLEASLPDDHPAVQMARGNLAATLTQCGDLHAALALAEKVERVFAATLPEDNVLLLSARGSLAVILRDLGEGASALELERDISTRFPDDRPEDDPARIAVLGNMASGLRDLGRAAEAKQLDDRCLELLRRRLPDDHPSLLTCQVARANDLRLLGEPERAAELLEEVLQQHATNLPTDHHDLQLVRRNLADALRVAGDHEAAAAHARTAAEIACMRLQSDWISPRALPQVASEAAELHAVIVALLANADTLQDSTEAALRSDALRLVMAGRAGEANLASTRRNLPAAAAAEAAGLQSRLAEAATRLERAIALPREGRLDAEGARVERDDAIRAAAMAKDELERAWRALAPRTGSPTSTAVDAAIANRLAAQLGPGEAAVVFCTYRTPVATEPGEAEQPTRCYGAFVVDAAAEVRWRPLGPMPEVSRQIGLLRTEIAEGGEPQSIAELSRWIDDRLFAPLHADLPEGTTRVLLDLDHDLHALPIALLPTANGLDLQIVRSLATPAAPASPDAGPNLLVLGNVDFDGRPGRAAPVIAGTGRPVLDEPTRSGDGGERQPKRFAALDNREAQRTKELFEQAFPDRTARCLEGPDASEAAFSSAAPGHTFVHVATHGYFAPEASFEAAEAATRSGLSRFAAEVDDRTAQLSPFSLTGLAMAGANLPPDELGYREGILTAQEILHLDLSACHLVTLSACETGLGIRRAGAGLASLRSAFHAAGARFVLASLWPVGDRAADALMRDFYTALWKDGASPHEALRRAQQAARERRAPARDWAGWVVSGR